MITLCSNWESVSPKYIVLDTIRIEDFLYWTSPSFWISIKIEIEAN